MSTSVARPSAGPAGADPRPAGVLTRLYRRLPPILHQPIFALRRRLLRGRPWWETPAGERWRDQFDPPRILQGPFEGLRLADDRPGRRLPSPKHLGTYEMELWPAIESLVAAGPERVIDIGAAEGTYAIGLARRLPEARHIAYEGEPIWRWRARRNARANGVEARIDWRGFCDAAALGRDLAEPARTLIICDCEGYEDELLRPDAIPGLGSATILVELHPMFREGIEARIRERFEATHEIERLEPRERTLEDLPPALRDMDPDAALSAMRETRRGTTPFFVMRPTATG